MTHLQARIGRTWLTLGINFNQKFPTARAFNTRRQPNPCKIPG